MKRAGCKAIQYSDQMSCADCALAWDVNDPEPPACRTLDEDTELPDVAAQHATERGTAYRTAKAR